MPKTTPGSQNNVDASKPIPNKNTESCGQKTDRFKKQLNYNKKTLMLTILN